MTKSRARTKNQTTRDEDGARRQSLRQSQDVEEPPPFGGSWRVLYAAVLINLAALVVLFYLFTRALG
jgi:hypothetical protein